MKLEWNKEKKKARLIHHIPTFRWIWALLRIKTLASRPPLLRITTTTWMPTTHRTLGNLKHRWCSRRRTSTSNSTRSKARRTRCSVLEVRSRCWPIPVRWSRGSARSSSVRWKRDTRLQTRLTTTPAIHPRGTPWLLRIRTLSWRQTAIPNLWSC